MTLPQTRTAMKHDAANKRPPLSGRWRTLLTVSLAAFMTLFLILPFVALVWRTFDLRGDTPLDGAALGDALLLSLSTTAVTALLVVLLGTPLAYLLARHDFPLKRLLALFVEMPIVMPPVVAGLGLLAAFGRRGLLGAPLTLLGLNLTFTSVAVVMAQLFVSAPFYIRAAQSQFNSLPREYEEAAAVDGADPWLTFWTIMLPLSARGLLSGLLLSWARALGEFGATILFAGNLQGRTQTMPLLVYGALERDLGVTFTTALILLALALLALGIVRRLTRLDDAVDPLFG